MKTKQTEFWSGDFGRDYTERNPQSASEMEEMYVRNYNISRTNMNIPFLESLSKDVKILEVGCNIGLQLSCLKNMGFKHLYGIELQTYAVEKAKKQTKFINIIQGNGFDIPFKDNFFDLVYTSGVLIHIAPENLKAILSEIVRCSKKYIWGFEYYSNNPIGVTYRGNQGFLWKMDYAGAYLANFAKLRLIKEAKYPYVTENEKGNEDQMFLIEKII